MTNPRTEVITSVERRRRWPVSYTHLTLPTHRRLVLESVFEYEMIGADRRRMIRGWEHDQTVYDRAGAILAICCGRDVRLLRTCRTYHPNQGRTKSRTPPTDRKRRDHLRVPKLWQEKSEIFVC